MNKILLQLFVLIMASLCSISDLQAATPQAAAKPSQTSPSDSALQQKIQQKLSKAKAGDGKFTVKVQGGVAYLSGNANVVQHKGAATRMAKTAGAKKVVNNIVVSEAAKDKAKQGLNSNKPRQATVRSSS